MGNKKWKKNGFVHASAEMVRHPAFFWTMAAGILLFSTWNTFTGISEAPIFDWDEARHGISAWEMLESGDYLVQTYQGEVDYWNLKPPLAFWGIVLSYRLFGAGAFALRFCSALALQVVVLVFMLFFRRTFGPLSALWGGFLFALVGVQMNHLFLHGDADALFYLFCFLAIVCFCRACLGCSWWLAGTGAASAAAFLAKAAHAGLLVLILLPSLILLRKVRRFRLSELALRGGLPAVLPVGVWAVARYQADGLEFFRSMLYVDVLARASTALEGNERGTFHYVEQLCRVLGTPLLVLFVLVAVLALLCRILFKGLLPADRVIVCCGGLAAAVPLVFYSFMTTKLSWYVWPSTIGFVMLTAWLVHILWRKHREDRVKHPVSVIWGMLDGTLIAFLLVGLLAMPDHRLMQYQYDTNTLQPAQSIFSLLPQEEDRQYHVVDPSGGQNQLQPSWILQGIYSGYRFVPGDLAQFAQSARPGDVLVIHGRSGPEQPLPEGFEERLELIAENRGTAAYTLVE